MSRTETLSGNGGRTFYNIVNGQVSHRVEKGDEGAVEREKNDGSLVYEKYAQSIIGTIVGARIEKKSFSGSTFKELQLDMDDDAMLQIPEYLWKSFVEFASDIKLSEDVKVSVYKSKKGNIGMNVSLETAPDKWENIEPRFTTWDDYETTHKPTLKNGMPSPVYDEEDESWDYRERDKFIRAELRLFCEKVSMVAEEKAPAGEPSSPAPQEAPPALPADDDIPF